MNNFQVDETRDLNANIVAIDSQQGTGIVYASLFGYTGSTKNMIKTIKNRKCPLRVLGRVYQSQPEDYMYYSSKVPNSDFSHTIIYKKDRVYKNSYGEEMYIGYIFLNIKKKDKDLYPCWNWISVRTETLDEKVIPELLLEQTYKKIYNNSSLPFLKEWTPYIVKQLLGKACMSLMTFYQEEDKKSLDDDIMLGYTIRISINGLTDIISEGLKNKKIFIKKDNYTPSEAMKAIEGLDGYLNTFNEVLAERVQKAFTPRFAPNKDKYSQELLDFVDYVSYKRKIDLYPAQKDVIQSISNCLDDKKAAFVIGSCGTGKTAMGTGIVIINNKNKKKMVNVVMCPAHLVKKWKYEIESIAPLSNAYIISDFHDLQLLMPEIKSKRRTKNIWLIVSKETAKFGYEKRPSAIWSKKKRGYICPECGRPLFKLKWEGRGRNRHSVQSFFNELSFLKESYENRYCMNKIQKWNNKKGKYEKHTCNAKLWESFNKDLPENKSDWIKLGKLGWVEKKLLDQIKNKLSSKTKRSKDESLLLSVIDDIPNKGFPIQRAPRKYPIAKYIRKYLKNKIDYFIADEMHQLKGGDSAQGEAFGDLAFASKKIIGLTGTLLNGYASGLFYILYRTFANMMNKEGFCYSDENQFTTEYGVIKKTSNYKWENGVQKDKSGKTKIKALPGVSPLIFTKFLLENAAFISQEDISTGLPAYTEIPVPIEMDNELRSAYTELETNISSNMKQFSGKNIKIMGQMLQTLSVYPDMPYDQANIIHPDTGEVIVETKSLDSNIIRNKDITFIDLVKKKKEVGEKVLVYYHWTNKTDLADRLPKLLSDNDIKSAVLKSSVKAELREEWIKQQLDKNIDVLICNPTLIETGLDLLDFTTIIYYQMGYNLYTMRQASRRSWRLSQTNDVEVYFLYYKNTIQEQALSLMATKLQASMAIEGKFSEEGLNALSNNEDIFSQIASSVAEGIKDTVDIEVFKKISVQSTIKKNNTNNIINDKKEININYSCFNTSKKAVKPFFNNGLQKREIQLLQNPALLFNVG